MRIIKFLVIVVMTFTVTGLKAQDSTFFANQYTKGLAILRKAQEYNDIDMEKKALFELLVLNDRDTTILQGLSQLYYNTGNFTSSILVSLDYLKKYPGNITALEICALSYEQLRIFDKAINFYEELYLRTSNTNVLYQIAFLQYTLKRFEESSNNINILEGMVDESKNLQLTRSDNTTQEIPFKAALFNLKGLIASGKGNKAEARTHFSEALKIAPDFEAAKLSLEALDKG